MARTRQFTAQQFIDAMEGTGGVLTTIAQRVGCHRGTVQSYIERYSTVKEAYEAEKGRIDDCAQSNIISEIENGDLALSKWWLSVKMPDEYGTRVQAQVTGDDGGAMEVRLISAEVEAAIDRIYGNTDED